MKKVTVNCLDGQGMIQSVTVEVPDDATQEQVEKAVQEALCVTGS
jgi:hypothetical protein